MKIADNRPSLICLQTMWRSCGTYILGKLGQDARFHPYFEPCSEWLSAGSPHAITDTFKHRLRLDLRHSAFDERQFEGYPFQPSGGVTGFKHRFSYDRYYMARDDDDPELERYVAGLIGHAREGGRTPLAKWCRFGMRSAWLDRVFAPVSIYILRGAEAMFRSYWSYGGRRSYFIIGSVLIVAKNRHLPVFGECADRLGIPPIAADTVFGEFVDAYDVVLRLSEQSLRDVVFLLWALNVAHNWTSDVIIDIDLMTSSPGYRKRIETALFNLVATTVSFDDVREAKTAVAPGDVFSSGGLACARRAVRSLGVEPCVGDVPTSAETARLLSAVFSA